MQIGKVCIYFFVLLGATSIYSPPKNIYGDEMIFDFETISKVELEIELYDLKINHLNVLGIYTKHPYLDGVATSTNGESKLHINAFVKKFIMEGTTN